MSSVLSIHVDGLRTVSPNVQNTEHWTVRNKRKKEQQKAVYVMWRKTAFGRHVPKPPVLVRLTRFGPQPLDSDNLAASFKAVQDCVADLMKCDDGDTAKIRFEYAQQIDSEYAVTIQVEAIK